MSSCISGPMESPNYVAVELPSPTSGDPLFTKKNDIMAQKGLSLMFPVRAFEAEKQYYELVDAMLKAARILNLNEIEWYFMEDDDDGPFSPRNELEALNLVHSILCGFKRTEGTECLIQPLLNVVLIKLDSFPVAEEVLRPGVPCQGDKEKTLLSWATSQGIRSKLDVAVFDEYGRGGRATEDIALDDMVLEIPQHVIICEDTVVNSDMFLALRTLEGINGETMALLWSMKERHDPLSKFAPYFASLPQSFNTGLSFSLAGLKALDGTIVLEEILQAKEHLRLQYNALFPSLSRRYPLLFPKELYGWDMFLWACELWYSNGLKISYPDGSIKTCLVPMAGILNHGLYPHITHYSKVDSKSQKLVLRAARPCKAGQQCFLHYGSFSNSHLLTFYGFLFHKDNPFDYVPIDIDLSDAPHQITLVEKSNLGFSHMIRGNWFSRSHLSPFGLPTRLLTLLRIALMEEQEVKTVCALSWHALVNTENEVKVYEALLSILTPMLDSIGESPSLSEDADTCPWDVKLAATFKTTQRELIQSVCTSCSLSLKAFT